MTKIILPIVAILFLGVFFVGLRVSKDNNINFSLCKDCNVIFITLTNLRYDHLSSNGYFRPTSPQLDDLAKESIVFDNAFSHASWTLTEGISLYTSLYPYQHKMMARADGSVLPRNVITLVDVLNNNGYKTAAFTGGFDYDPKFGLMNRFGEYQGCEDEGKTVTVSVYGKLSCTVPKALEWIKNNASEKFFVHVQGFDAHCPFSQEGGYIYDKEYKGAVDYSKCLWTFDKTKPQVIDAKLYYPVYSPDTKGKTPVLLGQDDIQHLVALYDESITLSDALLGSFLEGIKSMGLYENTIIIFTSEHGDMFGKDGRFMRGGPLRGTMYDDVLHVPLFIKHPKLKAQRIDGLVEQIDVMPTILDFLSLKKDFSQEGKTLIPLIREGKQVRQYVFAGSEYNPGGDSQYFPENTRIETIRSKEFKLIKESFISADSFKETLELYDMINDKEELNNLATTTQENTLARQAFQELQALLSDWSEKMRGENPQ